MAVALEGFSIEMVVSKGLNFRFDVISFCSSLFVDSDTSKKFGFSRGCKIVSNNSVTYQCILVYSEAFLKSMILLLSIKRKHNEIIYRRNMFWFIFFFSFSKRKKSCLACLFLQTQSMINQPIVKPFAA